MVLARWCAVTAGGSVPAGRCSHTLTVARGEAWLVGGGRARAFDGGETRFEHFGAVHALCLASLGWRRVCTSGFRPSARRGHSATLWRGDTIVVFGGMASVREPAAAQGGRPSGSGSAPCAAADADADADADAGPAALSNELLLLDLVSESWEAPVLAGEAPQRRRGHSAVLLGDGKTLAVFGGVWTVGPAPPEEARARVVHESLAAPLFLLDLESRCWSSVKTRGLSHYLGDWTAVVFGYAFHASGLCGPGSRLLFVGGSVEHMDLLQGRAGSYISDRVLVLSQTRSDRAGAGAVGADTQRSAESSAHGLSEWTWDELRVKDSDLETPWNASRMYHSMTQLQGSDLWAVWGGLTGEEQCTNELALIQLPPVAAGPQRALQVRVHGQPPSARNSSTLTQVPCGAEGHPRLLVFGGGVFPDSYFGDTHVVDLLELCPSASSGQAAAAAGAEGGQQGRPQQPSHPYPQPPSHPHGTGPAGLAGAVDPRQDGPGMDVEVHLAGGRRLFATRAALVACSDYFRALWCGPFSEGAASASCAAAGGVSVAAAGGVSGAASGAAASAASGAASGAGPRPIVRLPGNIDEDEETAVLLLQALCAGPRADVSPLLPTSWEALASLLEAAAVVAADALVAAATQRLAAAADVVNVGHLLALADAQHLPALRQSCLAFCAAHWGALSRAVDLAFPPAAPRPALRDTLAGLAPEALRELEQRLGLSSAAAS